MSFSVLHAVIATAIVCFALAHAVADSSDDENELQIKKRLGGRVFRRPWAQGTGWRTFGKRGGGRFVNFVPSTATDNWGGDTYTIQKRPGARFLGGSSGGWYGGGYGGYAKRPGGRFYRDIDEMERDKKPGARFMSSYYPRTWKRAEYDDDDDNDTYDDNDKRSSRSYGYPSWLRNRAG